MKDSLLKSVRRGWNTEPSPKDSTLILKASQPVVLQICRKTEPNPVIKPENPGTFSGRIELPLHSDKSLKCNSDCVIFWSFKNNGNSTLPIFFHRNVTQTHKQLICNHLIKFIQYKTTIEQQKHTQKAILGKKTGMYPALSPE